MPEMNDRRFAGFHRNFHAAFGFHKEKIFSSLQMFAKIQRQTLETLVDVFG